MRVRHGPFVPLYAVIVVFCYNLTLAGHALASPHGSSGSGYHLVKRIVLGGEGSWDYLEIDPRTHHLFITRATHVMVVDADQGKVVGDVPNTPFVHGIAVAPEFGRGYTTNGDTSAVTIFDTNTFQKIGEANTGKEPDAILYDPSSKRVFVMNRKGTSTVIDAASGKVEKTVTLGGQPEFGVADGKGHVFVNLEDKSELVEIDSLAMKLENTWSLAPCKEPSGLAIDTEHERLVVGCHNKMMAFVDGTNGKVVGTVRIGEGVDANRFDPGTGFAFASCGDGTLTVAHEDSPDKFTLVDTVRTLRGARTMAIDLSTHRVYLVTAQFGPAPAASADNPRPRPTMEPNTFTLLVLDR
jgi:YVTN family beta-propeller protein